MASDPIDLPHHRGAEEAVLGSLLQDRDAYAVVAPLLASDAFYVVPNRIVFEAIAELVHNGSGVDVTLVGALLEKKGDFERIGGALELTRILECVPSAANVAHHAAIVADRAVQRRLIRLAEFVKTAALSGAPVAEIRREALAALEAAASPSLKNGFQYLDLDAIAANGIPPIDWLVPGWLVRGDVAIVGGPAYSAKTTTGADLAIAISSGRPWCGVTPSITGAVLWFDEEAGSAETARNFLRLGAKGIGNLHVASGQGVNVATAEGFARLEREIEKTRPLVVMFDSETQCFGGIDENSAEQVGPVFGRLFRLRDKYGVTFLIVHHLKKPGDVKVDLLAMLRGSTAFATQASTVWVAERVDDVTIDLLQAKRRGAQPTSIRIGYAEECPGGAITLTGGPRTTPTEEKAAGLRRAVLEAITQAGEAGLTRDQVLDRVTGADSAILKVLNALRDDGEIRQNGHSLPNHPAPFVRSSILPFRGGERRTDFEADSVPPIQNGEEWKNGQRADGDVDLDHGNGLETAP